MGAVLFVIGLLAVGVIMVLFATGAHDLPLWLNLTAMLAPVGFGIGLFGIFLEARSGRVARAERAASRAERAASRGERAASQAARVEAPRRTPRETVEPEAGQSV